MKADFARWLKDQGYTENVCASQISRMKRVEPAYGDLEKLTQDGSLDQIMLELRYSQSDARSGRPNPSRFPIDGDVRTGLQSYKNAINLDRRFIGGDGASVNLGADAGGPAPVDPTSGKLALERDMQSALRRTISSLEAGLDIIDEGVERSVETGSIDILCRDRAEALVVVELEAGTADSRSIARILGYMGDLVAEGGENVRGILVAHEFDKRTKSAARTAGSVKLMRYRVAFQFEED